ncbi:MFS transporter [Aliirhizobium cellulosilyticum]|uniref:Putative MFS family arabinose efflux permease n=1 Tax=Aliirhizobium cellulosilyticum TaxID=393664 RepID=A0A7W6TF41_9HYPH|nr:MFS transporter [Rhizobium cellulosilyticum]MBB4349427.1 putative MFS family arabinose efflux permease [Rhizobium cellulosilyticum]MBB4412351.1 putative MFS family arabinose efflux permease [Rhizobium cellulosilyticum]MBB4446982.1 putative MFS family arabinose efflux permease [Rhizobium cellulosilyticum]
MTIDTASRAGHGTKLSATALYAMATASGIAVANIYYNQPMLGIMEDDFPQQITGFIPTATQLGYALGLLFILPLGDIVHRRKLIVGQFLILAFSLVLAALAPTAGTLVVASLFVGASATVAQQIVPFAASLTDPEKRGSTIGTVMAGVLSGILFSRTLSGFVGEHFGWREMFWLGVPMALAASALMYITLPDHAPVSRMAYKSALRSLAHLWRRESALRTAALMQAALFGSFTAFWTVLALYLATPKFNLGADVAGLFGIVGAVGVFAAPLAGKVADRKGPHFVVWLGIILTIAAWLMFGVWTSLIALVIGVIVLDFGIQSALVSNQHIVYALDPDARSRLNTIFMTAMFLGGSAGAALASAAWSYEGWIGVAILGGALGIAALFIKSLEHRRGTEGDQQGKRS